MKRSHLLLAMFLFAFVAAAPALAQSKDPFEPNPGGGEQQERGGGGSSERDPFNPGAGSDQPVVQETPNDPTEPPETEPEPTQEPAPTNTIEGAPLSNTGFDITTWGGIAYLLIVVGAAALIAGRMFVPALHRRRK